MKKLFSHLSDKSTTIMFRGNVDTEWRFRRLFFDPHGKTYLCPCGRESFKLGVIKNIITNRSEIICCECMDLIMDQPRMDIIDDVYGLTQGSYWLKKETIIHYFVDEPILNSNDYGFYIDIQKINKSKLTAKQLVYQYDLNDRILKRITGVFGGGKQISMYNNLSEDGDYSEADFLSNPIEDRFDFIDMIDSLVYQK